MESENIIGKKVKVKILQLSQNGKYYICQAIEGNDYVFIENTGDYYPEELLGTIDECIIINIVQDKLIGFLITSRKFVNDLKKIENKLKVVGEIKNVKDIYLMERLNINGKVIGLYMVDEGEIGKYYLDDVEIGIFYKKTIGNNIVFKNKTIEDELGKQIRDVVQSIDLTKKEISLRAEEEKQRHTIEDALGIMERDINSIAILDLNQKIHVDEEFDKKEQANEQINLKNKQEQIMQNTDYTKKDPSTTRDINIKQELKMNSKVTDMKTLGQVLEKENKIPQMEGKKFTKMGVIESNDRDDLIDKNGQNAKVNTTRYSFVAIANDGTVVPMELSQDHQEGNNPREVNYQVNQQGEVEQDDVLSRYNIGNGTFAIKNGQYGELKVYHSPKKTIGGDGVEGNKSLDRELETDNVWLMKKEVRDLAGEYKTGYRSVEKGYQEAKLHEDKTGKISKEDNGKLKAEDIDGDKNTKSHQHLTEKQLEELKKKQKEIEER